MLVQNMYTPCVYSTMCICRRAMTATTHDATDGEGEHEHNGIERQGNSMPFAAVSDFNCVISSLNGMDA